jgi:protein-disulfide isomerase
MTKLRTPVTTHDHADGPDDAPVTLVEYGDYECPHCGRAYPIVKALQKAMGKSLRFVFRNFPISESHPHAVQAAGAAEAAARQNKFWEMHDLLYEHQAALESDDLLKYATRLHLRREPFVEDAESEATIDRINADIASGARSGVNGTPTFFINDVRHDGNWDFDSLSRAIESARVGTSPSL